MKKRIIFLLAISMILGLILTGCGEKKPEALAGDHKAPSTMEELKITGESRLFIRRNQNSYTLNGSFEKKEDAENFKVGCSFDNGYLYKLYVETESLATNESLIISMGDIPIPIIQEQDKLYLRKSESLGTKLYAKPITFVGFGPLFYKRKGDDGVFIGADNSGCINSIRGHIDSLKYYEADNGYNKTNTSISLENVCELDYGQKIIADYQEYNAYQEYNTTKNHTLKMLANCSCYKYTDETSLELPLLGKESYSYHDYEIYNPTKLSKGYWALCISDEMEEEFAVILVQ